MSIVIKNKVQERTLDERIAEYIILDAQIKSATKKADELKASIKLEMTKDEISKVEMDDSVVECYTMKRKSIVEEKAIQYIKEIHFMDCIVLKESLDEAKVIEKITDGDIDVEDFERECYNITEITALKVTKKKAPKKVKL